MERMKATNQAFVFGMQLLVLGSTIGSERASKNKGLDSPTAFGLVDMNSDSTGCLTLKSDRAQPGDVLSIVCTSKMSPDSAWIVRAEIVSRQDSTCRINQGVFGDSLSYYDVRFPPTGRTLGLGVVTAAPVNVALIDSMHVQLTVADIQYVVYECASLEGIHVFVRDGSKLIWHEYYYVPYDLESNCNDEDFEGLKD
jgi:hypothetical protein